MDILADNVTEPQESFEVEISTVNIIIVSGVRQVLTDEDQKRIIIGQKRARVFIVEGMHAAKFWNVLVPEFKVLKSL